MSVNLSGAVNALTLTRYVEPDFNGPLQYPEWWPSQLSEPIAKSSTDEFLNG